MKKIFALLVTLTLVCSLLSVPAFAAEATASPYVVDAKSTNPNNYDKICGFIIDTSLKQVGDSTSTTYQLQMAVGSYNGMASLEAASKIFKFTTSTIVNGGYWPGAVAVDIPLNGSAQMKYTGTTPLFSSDVSTFSIMKRYGSQTLSIDKITWLDSEGNALSGYGKLSKTSSVLFDAKVTNPDNYANIYGYKINVTNSGTMGLYFAKIAVGDGTAYGNVISSWVSKTLSSYKPGVPIVDIAAGASGDWQYVSTTPIFSGSNSYLSLSEDAAQTTFSVNSIVWLDANGKELSGAARQVVFNTDGGSSITSITRYDGDSQKAPADPRKTGYSFDSWYIGETKAEFPYTIAGDLTLTAHWIAKQYTVKFNAQKGSEVASQVIGYNTTVSAPETPTKAGYVFDNWYTAANGGDVVTFPYTVLKNTTVYAHWIKFSTVTVSSVKSVGATKSVVKLTWDAANGADQYKVYIATTKDGEYKAVATVKETKCSINSLKTGTKYYFKVVPYQGSKAGRASEIITVKTK